MPMVRKSILILGFLLKVISCLSYAQDLANLEFYQLSETSDKLVVSVEKNTHIDSTVITNWDTLYIDWWWQNNSNVTIPSSYLVTVSVDDNAPIVMSNIPSGMVPEGKYNRLDQAIPPLTPGTHTIKIVLDSNNSVTESNEEDNEYSKTITVIEAESGLPNLTLAQPAGWSNKIVVSTMKGLNTDSEVIESIDTLFIDVAVLNNGGEIVTDPFSVDLFIDGQLKSMVSPDSSSISPKGYQFYLDSSIESLSAGSHTIRVVVDSSELITETDETDNESSRTITVVSPSCYPLSAVVSPQGAGTITKTVGASCGSGETSLNDFTDQDFYPNRQPEWQEKASENSSQAIRAKNFRSLMAKAETEGRVGIIVGLRTQGPRDQYQAVKNFADIAANSPTILEAQTSLLNKMMDYDISSTRKFKFIPYLAMEVDAACLEYLAHNPMVKSIEEDLLAEPFLEYSSPVIGATAAWDSGFSGAGQTVVILDTGVDKTHPFLEGRVVSEACYSNANSPTQLSLCPGGVTESTDPGSAMPCSTGCGHGTHVAGIAAGKSYEGTDFSGVAKDANIIGINVFKKVGFDAGKPESGATLASGSDIIAGLERAIELSPSFNIASVNMSLGGGPPKTSYCDDDNPAAKAAIDTLRSIGIATVIASGNAGWRGAMSWPACYSSGVSVGSTNVNSPASSDLTTDNISIFSNIGPTLDLLAPGMVINSSIPEAGFAKKNGTSMAAPQVAGAWAVLKSKVPQASVGQVLSALVSTGKPIGDVLTNLLKPRIQVDAALNTLTLVDRYSPGTSLTLTAEPNTGFQFKSWDGCDSADGNQCTVQVNSVQEVTANFEPILTGTPDLVLTKVNTQGSSPETEVIINHPFRSALPISIDLSNGGLVGSGAFRLSAYLSADETITIDDFWLGSCNYDSGLQAGATASCNGGVKLYTGDTEGKIIPGKYFLGAILDDQGVVAETDESNNILLSSGGVINLTHKTFVPIILSSAGMNNSFFTSEMTITNRGNQEATFKYYYRKAFGEGDGCSEKTCSGSDSVAPGQQLVIPDAMTYLAEMMTEIPKSGNRGGTLDLEISGSDNTNVMVRTTTAVPEGRAGLAYFGIPIHKALRQTVFICGLRQNETDRSNVAIQNVDRIRDLDVRVTIFPGDTSSKYWPHGKTLPIKNLQPLEFYQYSGILEDIPNGFVEIRPVGGSASFYAYGVINDQANSDGSFIFPVTASSLIGKTGQTLPVIVETANFSSELTLTNPSQSSMEFNFRFVADAIQTPDNTATFSLTLDGPGQRIIPDFVEFLRSEEVEGIGPRGPIYAGALFATPLTSSKYSIVIGARTGSPGGGGQYGLFYNAVPFGEESDFLTAWVYGLQQNEENRSNLAIVNTGEVDSSSSTFALDIYNGETGNLVTTINTTVDAARWKQINTILLNAPGTTQGYVNVRRLSGFNPFIAYGVINDGSGSGERSGDGAYLPTQ